MKDREYIIDDIRVKITKDRAFATIRLESYEEDRLSKLIGMLSILRKAGFTKYDTSHDLGCYDAVENISLEFYEELGKIDQDFLK